MRFSQHGFEAPIANIVESALRENGFVDQEVCSCMYLACEAPTT